MFKSSKNAKPARKPGGGAAMMQQMGFQVPNYDGADNDDDDNDDDLEAELRRLQQGSSQPKGNQRGGKAPDLRAFHNDVNQLLHDIDRPINEDEISDVDEDELLAELNELYEQSDNEEPEPVKPPQASSPANLLSILQTRQDMYTKAVATAKATGDASKARRLDRQLNTIQDLLKSVRSGGTIDESEIPPEVFVASAPGAASASAPAPTQKVPVRAPSPPRPVPPPQVSVVQPRVVPKPQPQPQPASAMPKTSVAAQPILMAVANDSDPAVERLKALALQAKQRGDMVKAKDYILQLRALRSGPNAPPAVAPVQRETYDNVQDEDDGPPPPPLPLKAPEPKTVMEALQQRHEELNKRGEEAASRGDRSKARRMERLCKQYAEAITATRKGLPYDYAELPDIPGFAPIPIPTTKPQPSAAAAAANPPTRPTQPGQQRTGASAPPTNPIVTRKNQQAQILRMKQEKFYKLAAQAKQQGDLDTAKKFLIAYKGLEQMIQAAESGLPVDMSQVPKLPDDENDMLNDDDLTQDLANADRDTIYRRLQDDLLRQVQLCARNQQIYSQMDVNDSDRHAREYKVLEQRCADELEKLRRCFQQGLKPPLFHYERRQMNIIQVNSDLGENDLEVVILRGINLPIPAGHSSSTLETYVAIEFPYPTETPQTARTRHAVGSENAEYPEGQHKFYIKRNDAKFRRLMNRKDLKLAVFYKAGFLRSDRPLGTASIKLANLEQSCVIHESVDLYEVEHKKKIEGKLEVKLRIREALGQTKASEILPQRWLVIDRFEETTHQSKTSTTNRSTVVDQPIARQQRRSQVPTTTPQSVQVLNYEASMLQQQIQQLKDQLSPDQLHQLQTKLRSIQDQSDQLVDSLRMGGTQAVKEHLRGLEQLLEFYDQEVRDCHQRRDSRKADICLSKKKLVAKEIETLTGKAPAVSSTRL